MVEAGEDSTNTKWVGFNVYAAGSDSVSQPQFSYYIPHDWHTDL